MAEKRDYYEVLSVERSAGKVEIDRAYRKLGDQVSSRQQHGDDAVEKFKEASEAYEVLSDPEKRARYDQYGHAGVDGATHQFNDVEDIFEAFGDLFGGGMFGDLFGGRGGGGRRRRSRRGADIRCNVTLTLEEAARGVSKDISFRRRVPCYRLRRQRRRAGQQTDHLQYLWRPRPSHPVSRDSPRSNDLPDLSRRRPADQRTVSRLPRQPDCKTRKPN